MLSKVGLLTVVGALIGLLPCVPTAFGQDSRATATQPGAPIWAVGQEWRFLVRQYGHGLVYSSDSRTHERSLIPRVQYEFHVKARVTELMRRDGRACVCIEFMAEPDAPLINSTDPAYANIIRDQKYILTLDAETSKVVEFEAQPEHSSSQLLEAEGCTALLPQISWFPIDWAISRSDLENPAARTELLNFPDFHPTPDRPTPNGALKRTVSPEKDGTIRITVGEVSLIPRKETGEPAREARCEVEQVWHPSEQWWRSFRRFSGGHIDLEAVRVSDPAGSGATLELLALRPGAASTGPAGSSWAVGQEWRFLVKNHVINQEYDMRAWVTELAKVDGRACVRIGFLAKLGRRPTPRTPGYVLTLDAQTWEVVQLEHPKWFPHPTDRPFEAEGYKLLFPIGDSPLDWIVQPLDLASTAAHEELLHMPGRSNAPFVRRTISAPEPDGTLRITVGVWVPTLLAQDGIWQPPQDTLFEIQQVWHPGELWWRSFRRLNHGQLELEATRVAE
jgi:hypothetical protein